MGELDAFAADLLTRFQERNKVQAEAGTEAAELLLSKIKGDSCSGMATALGALLLRLDPEAADLDCAKLTQEWMMEHYWGARVRNEQDTFDACFEGLKAINANSRDNALGYGDIDYSIWYVESGEHRIICSECHCSCADDNIHLWIKWPLHFRGRTCSRNGEAGTRSIAEYEKNWELGYGDGRDKGYCFDYSDFDCKVKDGLFSYFKVYWSIWYLGVVKDALVDPDEYFLPKVTK